VECCIHSSERVTCVMTGIAGAGATERSSVPATTTDCSSEEAVACEDHL
jgi:hypothetical protein